MATPYLCANDAEEDRFAPWMHQALRQTPSWLVSMVFHMVLVLTLALMPMSLRGDDGAGAIHAYQEPPQELEELEPLEDEPLEELDLLQEIVSIDSTIADEEPDFSPANDLEAAGLFVEPGEIGPDKVPPGEFKIGKHDGTGTGRGDGGIGGPKGPRVRNIEQPEVLAALKWLTAHQLPNGAWSFAHHLCPTCNGQCRNPGNHKDALHGATAIAILPFLGAAQTHKRGQFKETVGAGLYFLSGAIKLDPMKGGSLHEAGGRMYSHGLASIALCEAYAMTNDRALHNPSQAAINYICYAQDPIGGGWRYEPRQRGDTSVVGWQIMALKSGHMAYLRVPPITIKKSYAFLDSVQANSGANYGYTGPGEGAATTAIGLLCRMYLGWKKDNPALERGVEFLSERGFSRTNMYYNYYATQVMRHYGGEQWDKWNREIRDWLLAMQAKGKGHEAGSWYVGGGHGQTGGRLYCTAMATMILEVYYRYLPIYGDEAVDEEFVIE